MRRRIRMRQSLILQAFHHKKSLEVNGVQFYFSLASSLEHHVKGNGLTFDAERADAQRCNDDNVYDCNVNAVYEESDAEEGDTGDTKTETDDSIDIETETRAKEEDCDDKLDL